MHHISEMLNISLNVLVGCDQWHATVRDDTAYVCEYVHLLPGAEQLHFYAKDAKTWVKETATVNRTVHL